MLGLGWSVCGPAAVAQVEVMLDEVIVDGGMHGTHDVAEFGGFRVEKVDQETADAMADLARFSDKGLWERVFRTLEAMRERQASGLVAVVDGADGSADRAVLYAPLDERLWREVAELPASGREAFRLFYDAAADALLATMRRPGVVGTAAEREAGERLYERYFMSSAGPTATDRLGDLAFERGEFLRAAALWEAVLDYHSGGGVDPLRLRMKRAIALHRAGDRGGFAEARAGLLARDGEAMLNLGGRSVTVEQALDELDGSPEAGGAASSGGADEGSGPGVYPFRGSSDEAEPRWRCTFLSEVGQVKLMEAVQSGWSAQGTGLHRAIPPVAADASRVYANWLGVVFALDRRTGKLLWTTRGFDEMVAGFGEMLERGSVISPGRYHVDVAPVGGGAVVLATAMPGERNRWNEPYRMQAYEAATGRLKWSSQGIGAMEDAGFCGPPAVVGSDVLVVTYPQEGRTLTLRQLSAADGSERWSMPLGEFEPINSRHGYEVAPVVSLRVVGDRVYVLTNGGAMLAVDRPGRSIAWALKYAAPDNLGEQNYNRRGVGPYTDRPGSVELVGGTLYVKEAGGNQLLAVDAESGRVLWQHLADRDAVIADHDDRRLYLLGADLMSREIGSGQAVWSRKLRASAVPGSLAVTPRGVVVSSEQGLLVLDSATGDVTRTFAPEVVGGQGATFTLLNGLTIIATPTGIVAYGPPEVSTSNASPQTRPATQPTDPASNPE